MCYKINYCYSLPAYGFYLCRTLQVKCKGGEFAKHYSDEVIIKSLMYNLLHSLYMYSEKMSIIQANVGEGMFG